MSRFQFRLLIVMVIPVVAGYRSASAESPRLDCYGDPLPPGAVARLGSLRLLCTGNVANVIFTPDGQLVAALLENGKSQFWEVATGRAVVAPADTRFIEEDSNRRKKQRDDTSQRLRTANPTLTNDDLRVAVKAPNGALIATSSRQQPFRIWDGRTLKELPGWPGQKSESADSLTFSPDGSTLAVTAPNRSRFGRLGPANCGTRSPDWVGKASPPHSRPMARHSRWPTAR